MKKFFKKTYGIIAVIVDVYALVQIFRHTNFRFPDLFENAWFGLFVVVTITAALMFGVFKVQEFLRDFAAYKQKVSGEFIKRMEEENKLYELCNKLRWRMDEIQLSQKDLTHQPN